MTMKMNSKNIGLLMITLVATSVGATYLIVNGIPDSPIKPSATGALLTGNVLVKQLDENGNIKALRQTGNHIVNDGMAIIISQVFNQTDGTHQNWTSGTVKYMQIGNGSTILGFDNKSLDDPLVMSATPVFPNCDRQLATMNNDTGGESNPATGSNLAEINVTAIATFSGANCASDNIQEAGIWTDDNDTGGLGHMFARNTFGTVNLEPTDSLELTWTFNFTDS